MGQNKITHNWLLHKLHDIGESEFYDMLKREGYDYTNLRLRINLAAMSLRAQEIKFEVAMGGGGWPIIVTATQEYARLVKEVWPSTLS